MGVRDMKRRQRSPQFSGLGLSVRVLLLFLGSGSFVNCAIDPATNVTYDDNQLFALQAIWRAWNSSNPAPDLPGWSSTQVYPCTSLSSQNSTIPSWRGVLCMIRCQTLGFSICSSDIISLSLSNASIAGVLPSDIGDIKYLTTLELTGNPKLTGPLPDYIENLWSLSVLDLHDNGFNETIPSTFQGLWNLLQLDLSGNYFTGMYPFDQTSTMDYLQVFSIGNNRFTGQIRVDAYQNKTDLERLDISNNSFTGPLPDLSPLKKLIHLDVSGNKFEGRLPDLTQFPSLSTANFGSNNFTIEKAHLLDVLWKVNASTALTTLNLSYNQLAGPLSSWSSLITLGSIQQLYLDNNTLSGTLNISKLLEWSLLQTFVSSSKGLGVMSLRNNSIERVIYNDFIITNITTVFKLQGSPFCDKYDSNNDGQRCFCTQSCYVTSAASDRRRIAIIAAVSSVLAVILVSLVVVGTILLKNRRYKRYLQLQFEQKFEEFDVKPTIFSYNELRAATQDFHEDMKLGQGSYGAVYKGVLQNGTVVAVKQLYMKTAQGLDEFLNEVVLITGMKHRNLVNLKGCCLREHQRLLVYEYVDNYDVEQILLGSRKQAVSWSGRLRICLGIARGLHYLHALAHPRIIHRDIKASNVLLDKNLEPKIADFGLALLFPDEESHIVTIHVAGTKGYLAPEYAALGQLSDKVDVYSFGVLCLEIISGRRNIDETAPLDEVYLSQRAWNLHEDNRLMELIDPQLHLTTDDEVRDVLRVINLSLVCIQTAAEKRPTMARIVSILQSDTESEVQVLGSGKGERPSYESLRSLKAVNDRSTGLESVTEEGSSSDGHHAKSHRPQNSAINSGALDLSEIVAR